MIADNYSVTESSLSGADARDVWDRFVERAPLGTVYHLSGWLEALRHGMGHDIRVHIVQRGEDIVAGAIVRRTARLGIVRAVKPWATAYNGVILAPGAPESAQEALSSALLRRYPFVRLVHGFSDVPLQGWSTTLQRTPVVQIADLDALWKRMNRHARQHIRGARDAGIVVDKADASTFYPLYVSTYTRQGTPMPLSENSVKSTIQHACEAGLAEVFLAKTASQEPAAALVVGYDSKRAYFMLAGNDSRLRKTNAMSLLWWTTFEKLNGRYNEVDLVGYGTEGIAQFKRTFTPESYPVLDCHAYRSPVSRMLIETLERARTASELLKALIVGNRRHG